MLSIIYYNIAMNKENNFIKYKPFIEKKIDNISLKDIEVDDYELNTSLDSKHVDISIITNKLLDKFQKIFREKRREFNENLEEKKEKDKSKYAEEDKDETNSILAKNFKQKIKDKVTELFQHEINLNDIQQKKHRTKINYTNLISCELLKALNNETYNKDGIPIGSGQKQFICTTEDLYAINTTEITKIHNKYNLHLQELELLESIEQKKKLIIKAGTKLNISRKQLAALEKELSDKRKTIDKQIKRSKDTVTDANSKLKDSRDKNKTNQKIAKVKKKSEFDILKYKDQYQVSKQELTRDIKSKKAEIKTLEKTYLADKKILEDEITGFKEQINILNDTNSRKLYTTNSKIDELKIKLENERNILRQLNSEDVHAKEVITSSERTINKIEQKISILEEAMPDNNKARFLKKLNIITSWSTNIDSLNASLLFFQPYYQKKFFVSFDPIKQNRDIIWKAIRYLQSYNLITMTDDTGAVHNSYYLNLEHWFKFQKHSFTDKDFIKNILPLLAAFLKYTAPNKVNDFLTSLDEIVDYLYKDPNNFSSSNNKESIILEALSKNKHLDIEVDENNNDTFFKNVKPRDLFFDDQHNKVLYWEHKKSYTESIFSIDRIFITGKPETIYLPKKSDNKKDVESDKKIYEDQVKTNAERAAEAEAKDKKQANKDMELIKAINDNTRINIEFENILYKDVEVIFPGEKVSEDNFSDIKFKWIVDTHEYQLDEIYSIKLAKTVASTKNSVTDKKGSNFITHQEQYNIPDRKPHAVILEVDINLSNFFDTGALKGQKVYKTKSEIKAFCTENKIPYEENNQKIYVSAYDKTDDVIHVAKRCLPGVQILKPDATKEKFQDMLKLICQKFK